MSIGSVLSIARTALGAQQVAIQTAGHNIANVETPGFTRQRVELRPAFPQQWPYGAVGRGVEVGDVTRVRDLLHDVTVRREAAGESGARLRHELLAEVEGVFGEPSENGLAGAMDAFWSSWSDLATAPTSPAARAVVVQRGAAAAQTLNGYDGRLRELREQTSLRLDNAVVEVNSLTARIAELNGRIMATEAGGTHDANDLRDQRDLAVDRLAALGDVQAHPRPDGSVHVVFGTHTVVDGIHARRIARVTDVQGNAAVAMADPPGLPITPPGGAVETLLASLNGDLQGAQDQLDALANALARAVNGVHAQGRTAANAAAPNFFVNRSTNQFDPAANPYAGYAGGTVNARTIGVNADVLADAALVATSSDPQRPSGNDVALGLASLRTASGALGVGVSFQLPDRTTSPPGLLPASTGTTLGDFYRATVTALGVRVQDAEGTAEVRATLADQARARRDAVTGVNLDEELTNLMRAQQAYAAAAKVVTAADEMMQTLLGMV